jgi:hypothetical protein
MQNEHSNPYLIIKGCPFTLLRQVLDAPNPSRRRPTVIGIDNHKGCFRTLIYRTSHSPASAALLRQILLVGTGQRGWTLPLGWKQIR